MAEYATNITGQRESGNKSLQRASKMVDAIKKGRASKNKYVGMWDQALWYLSPEHTEGNDPALTLVTGATSRVMTQSRHRLHSNQMIPIYRTTMDLLQSQFPNLTVAPASPSYDNIRKALATRQCARAWWMENSMQRRLEECAQWLSPCGNAFLHVYFNPGTRKVVTDTVGPYDVVYEKGSRTVEESRFVALRRRHDKDELKESFPDHEEYIDNLGVATSFEGKDSKSLPVPEDRVVVWYVYYPNGDYKVLAGPDKWLWEGTLPKGAEPLHLIRFLPVQQSLWGVSQLYPLIDSQALYNEMRNLTIDIARMTSNPVWIVPTQSMVDPSSLSNAPGAIVWYNGHTQAPTRVRGVEVPQHLFELQGRPLAEMQDIAGVHSVSMGKRAVGVVSGKAMDALGQRDANQLTPVRLEMEYAVTRAARTAMILWKHFIPEETHVRMFDPAVGRVTYEALKGTDLLEAPEVYMETGTLFKSSQADRDDALMLLHERGLASPDEVRKQLSLRIGEQDAMMKMVHLDQARAALDAVRSGLRVTFWPGPETSTVIEVFEEFMSGADYYSPILEWTARAQVDPTAVQFLAQEVEIANYIRDIVVCLKLPANADPNMVAQQLNSPLFPRSAPSQQGGIALANAPTSQGAAQQAGQGVSKIDGIRENVHMAQSAYDALKGTAGITGGLG